MTTLQTKKFFDITRTLETLLNNNSALDSLLSLEIVGDSIEIKIEDIFSTPELEEAFDITDDDFIRLERNGTKTIWINL